MDKRQAELLCNYCNLGTLVTGPFAVAGGLLHQVWQLETTQGRYAVKQLNPAIMRKVGIHEEYRLTERIAATFAREGVPAVAALSCHGDQLQEIEGESFLLYPWIEGEVRPSEAVGPGPGSKIGAILAEMHGKKLHVPELAPPEGQHFRVEDWDILAFHAADRGISWAHQVRIVVPSLVEWSKLYEDASSELGQFLVVSHRDLDQKNVLWQRDGQPRLIDWEATGLINPTMDLVGTALAWSGQSVGQPHRETFDAMIRAYIDAGGGIHASGLTALHGYMGIWLGWLLFNMRRSLGESVSSEEERQLGVQETKLTLAILRGLAAHADVWAAWLDVYH